MTLKGSRTVATGGVEKQASVLRSAPTHSRHDFSWQALIAGPHRAGDRVSGRRVGHSGYGAGLRD